MGLRLKFNLVLILVFTLGLAASGYVSKRILEANAQEETTRNAELMMGAVLGVDRARLVIDGRSGLAAPAAARFDALVARRVARDGDVQHAPAKRRSTYKEATLNPTNPRDRAVE
jgi:protein-histidine pros-kinase